MKLVADLHIHSHYSRATSKDLTFERLTKWAQLKGVQVVGSGDIAHPGWLQEMRDKLAPAEEGLFRLKDETLAAVQKEVPPACQAPVRFMLAGEISSIYRKRDKTRKVHNVIFAPDLEAVAGIQARLEKIGNIRSDGRPILGLPSRDLLEIILEVDERCELIPAHIWTPWFSLLGSKSGYDSVEECFDDLTPRIFAVETGLSSDPPMNWRVSQLDCYVLVSNSDAHSPQKLAREATLFDTELSYPALFEALKSGDPARFKGTIEFFPEEGKYHLDGHRKCNVAWEPPETLAHGGRCPVCGKPVTIGVMHRVEMLADRPAGQRPARTHPYASLIPLPEILSQVHSVGPTSKRVQEEYFRLLGYLGPELAILQELPLEDIAGVGGQRLAEGIARMRAGQVTAIGGYDGEYGIVKVFGAGEILVPDGQMSLFGEDAGDKAQGPGNAVREEQATYEDGQATELVQPAQESTLAQGVASDQPRPVHDIPSPLDSELSAQPADRPQPALLDAPAASRITPHASRSSLSAPRSPLLAPLNDQQRAAVLTIDGPLLIVAGPGTGKTRTLTVRIASLIQERGVAPDSVLAITFTNKAAGEMAERLTGLLGEEAAGKVTIKTFHAFGVQLLREYGAALDLSPNFAILAEEDRPRLLRQLRPESRQQEIDRLLGLISAAKNRLLLPDSPDLAAALGADDDFPALYAAYEAALRASQALDFDDLILQAVRLLESSPEALLAVQQRYRWISVDEYQDVNLAQYRLLRLLTGQADPSVTEPANLCVIGDPNQAIYGFRGADRRYFLRFQADYPGAKILHLSQNYRSTQLILDAATQVIAPGRGRFALHDVDDLTSSTANLPLQSQSAMQALADFAEQVKLEVYRAPTDKAEAEYVVHQIEQMVGGTSYFSLDSGRVDSDDPAWERSFADFAVLYRLGAQSRLLEEAFQRSGIPFQSASQRPLASHRVVRDALAFLWLLNNPRSRVHGLAMLEAVGLGGIEKSLEEHGGALGNSGELGGTQGTLVSGGLERLGQVGGLTLAKRQKLAELVDFWRQLEVAGSGRPAAGLARQVGDFLALQRGQALDEADQERLRQLALRAEPFGSRLRDFLEAVALQSEADVYDPRADRVALMTLHAAKGLEFPVVFIVGCEEGLLPYARQDETPDPEEERRLFYVGLTRAQQKLVLIHARKRFLYGQAMQNAISPFVNDIEAALKEIRELQRHRTEKPEPDGVQLSLF